MARQDDGTETTPGEAFGKPRDVLDRDDLCYEDKLEILQRWRADARDLDGENDERLSDIDGAIEQLQADVALDPSKPAGAPSGKGYRPSD